MLRDLRLVVYILTWKVRSWLTVECLLMAIRLCPQGESKNLLIAVVYQLAMHWTDAREQKMKNYVRELNDV